MGSTSVPPGQSFPIDTAHPFFSQDPGDAFYFPVVSSCPFMDGCQGIRLIRVRVMTGFRQNGKTHFLSTSPKIEFKKAKLALKEGKQIRAHRPVAFQPLRVILHNGMMLVSHRTAPHNRMAPSHSGKSHLHRMIDSYSVHDHTLTKKTKS